MMDRYPKYGRGDLQLIYSKLKPKNKKIVDEFSLVCSTSANPRKVDDIKRSVLQLHDITCKDLDNITLEDLRKFLVVLNQSDREIWSKHDIKIHLKRFLKFQYKDWSERFNALKEIKNESVGMNQEKLNSKTLLTKTDIETILKKENDILIKTFFICAYETGMRPSELRTLKWSDIKFNVDDDLSEINVFMSKNKKHKTVYVKTGTFYLKKLQNSSKSDYVFPSRENISLPVGDSTATRWISLLGKHIDKKIYPYLLRHTRSQELYGLVDEGKLSERVVQRFLGHSKSMRDLYSELSSKTLKDAVTKTIYKIEELPPQQRQDYELKIKNLETEFDLMKKQVIKNTEITKEIMEVIKILKEKNKKKS